MKIDLNKEVQYVKGVGPNRVKLLNQFNIYTLTKIEALPRKLMNV